MRENNQVHLDAQEIKTVLEYIVKNNRKIQEEGKVPVSVELIGEAGLGKTSIAMQLAKENKLDLVKLNLSQIEEIGDLVGFPIRQFKMTKGAGISTETIEEEIQVPIKKMINGEMVEMIITKTIPKTITKGTAEEIWVDETTVDDYAKRGYEFTGEKRMGYCPPEWIADKKEGGILLLDDWTRCDFRFTQAIMELIDKQEYISWKLPKDWHIILTSNPDNGNYLVNTIDIAQRTRFVSIYMKWDPESWGQWAERNGIDGRCINFLLMHPEIIENSEGANPRSMTTFFNCISSIEVFDNELGLIQNLGEGSVGSTVSTMFTAFIANKLDLLISPKRMLLEGATETVIEELRACIGTGSEKRLDIASLLTNRFINYTIFHAENAPLDDKVIARIVELIKASDVFTDDLRYVMVKRFINSTSKQKFQKILIDKTVQELAMK